MDEGKKAPAVYAKKNKPGPDGKAACASGMMSQGNPFGNIQEYYTQDSPQRQSLGNPKHI